MTLSSCQTSGGGGSGGGGGASVGRVKVIPVNRTEQKVLNQAVIGGAVVGATAGYLIAQNNDINPALGALAGAAVGGMAGNIVGKAQIKKLRVRQLNVNETAELVNDARAYNQQVAAQIRTMRAQVAALDSQTRNKQAILRSIKSSHDNVDLTITRGEKAIESTSGPQASAYRSQLSQMKSQRAQLLALYNQAVKQSGGGTET